MAINLNDSIYGRQFAAFADFAKANEGSPDTLVCMGENEDPTQIWDKDTNPRRIVAKTDGDAIRSRTKLFFRFGEKAATNNEVRRIFRDTILSVCGVNSMEELPEQVREVMRSYDYNKGRPLSVRRIKAVTDAVVALDQQQKDEIREYALQQEAAIKGGVIGDGVSVDNHTSQEIHEEIEEPKAREIDIEEDGKPVESLRVRLGANRANIKPISQDRLANKVARLCGGLGAFQTVAAAVVTETVKAIGGRIDEDELEPIEYDDCERLFNEAENVGLKDFTPKTSTAEEVSKSLNAIRRRASEKFDELFPDDSEPTLMREIRRNLFMNFAIQYMGTAGLLALGIKKNHEALLDRFGNYDQGEMVNLSYAGFLKTNSNLDIRK